MSENFPHGDELCLVIEQFAELEWRKFRSSSSAIVLRTGTFTADNSKLAPYTSFRFRHEDAELIARLMSAVDTYQGAIAWHMSGHQRLALPGKNWVIRPLFVEQVQEKTEAGQGQDAYAYIAENYPDFARTAYFDLPNLADHVRKALG